MVARPLGSVGRTARPKRRARNSPYRGDRYRVFDRLEGQLSPRWAGVRLLGSRNRSGRHHPWVSDRQNRCYCLVANFKYVWLAFRDRPATEWSARGDTIPPILEISMAAVFSLLRRDRL